MPGFNNPENKAEYRVEHRACSLSSGGLAGGDTQSAADPAQAGKTTVENNYPDANEAISFDKELANFPVGH